MTLPSARVFWRVVYCLALVSLLSSNLTPLSINPLTPVAIQAAPATVQAARMAPPLLRSSAPTANFVPPRLLNAPRTTNNTVLAQDPPELDDISANRLATSSSFEPGHPPTDVNNGTSSNAYWAGYLDTGPAWWQVDLGSNMDLAGLWINLHVTCGSIDWSVSVSADNTSFTTIETLDHSDGGYTNGINYIYLNSKKNVRYIRVDFTLIGGDCPSSPRPRVVMTTFKAYGTLTVPPHLNEPPAECPCNDLQGDPPPGPFNPRTGVLWTTASDLQVLGNGPSITWDRSYLTHAITTTTQFFGLGWQHNYGTHLILPNQPGGETGIVTVVAPQGNYYRFQDAQDGTFRAMPGVYSTLAYGNNGYTQTMQDQSKHVFDTTGKLIGVYDGKGRQLNLTYNSATPPQLTRVRDALNPTRALTITYTLDGVVDQVTDGTRTVSYGYLNGDLHTVTDVMGRTTTYTYQSHLLTKIQNPLGQTVEETQYDQYTPKGRVIHQTLLDGRTWDVTYNSAATVMVITGPDGTSTTQQINYDAGGKMISETQNGVTVKQRTSDPSFAPGTSVDQYGNKTVATFNTHGQPQGVTDPAGATTTIGYDSLSRPVTITDALNRKMISRYDTHNNLIRQTTGIATGFPLGYTTIYTYNVRYPNKNWLEGQRTPDGVVTRYDYNTQGQLTQETLGYGSSLARVTSYDYDTLGRRTVTTEGSGTPLARTDRTIYNADNTVARAIRSYQDGIYDVHKPDEDIVTSYGYDKLGRTVAVTDTLGRVNATHYDARGHTDWSITNLVPFQLDTLGQPVFQAFSPVYPDRNVATLYAYDGLGRSTVVTTTGILTGTFNTSTRQFSEATTRATRTEYDALNRPLTVTLNYRPDLPIGMYPDVNVQTVTRYDDPHHEVWHRDALNHWDRTQFDALSRPVTVTLNYENGNPLTVDPANLSWATLDDTDIISVKRYRKDGQLDRAFENYVTGTFVATAPISDVTTTYSYDAIGRQTAITGPSPSQIAYDPVTGRVLATKDDSAAGWNAQEYDALGKVLRTTRNCYRAGASSDGFVTKNCDLITHSSKQDLNVPTEHHYDSLGRTYETVNALGIITHTNFDRLDRSIATIQNYRANSPTTTITNVTSLTAYDGLGRTTIVTDAAGYATQTSYDELGNPSLVTDATSRVTQVGYDGTGTPRWTRSNDGRFTVKQVDGLGRVIATIQNYQDGIVAVNEPRDRDLLTRMRYNSLGQQVQTIDAAGRATQFGYDGIGNLTSVTENAVIGTCLTAPCNVTTQYRYDHAGNRRAITDARGNTRRFTYNERHQLTEEVDALGRSFPRWYRERGLLGGYGRGYQIVYDKLNRRTDQAVSAENSQTNSIYETYDLLGRRTEASYVWATYFAYDPLGRVKSIRTFNEGSQSRTINYAYTALGQRSQMTYPDGSNLVYTYLPNGQLDTVTQGSTTLAGYTYDSAGRVQQVARANGASTIYTYDSADRLQDQHTLVNGTQVSRFEYDLDRGGLRRVVTETLGLQTATPSPTSTNTPTQTATNTPTQTATNTPTTTPTTTPSVTNTPTATASSGNGQVGTTTILTQQDDNPAGVAEAFRTTASTTGAVNTLSIYLDSTNTATTVIVGLYSNSGTNHPATLLGQAAITNATAGTWNSGSIAATTVTAGTTYWIAVLGPAGGGTVAFRDTTSGGPAETSSTSTLNTLPSGWTTGATYAGAPISAYASYTATPSTPTATVTATPTTGTAATATPTATAGSGTSTPTATATSTSTPTMTPTSGPGQVGATTVGDQVDSNAAGQAEAFLTTANASGMVNQLTVYVDASNTATSVVVGLYANAAGDVPGTLLGQTTISAPTAGAWNSGSMTAVAITVGTKYWLAVLGPTGAGTFQFVDQTSGGKAQTSSQTNLTALPTTWSAGSTYNNAPVSAYASYNSSFAQVVPPSNVVLARQPLAPSQMDTTVHGTTALMHTSTMEGSFFRVGLFAPVLAPPHQPQEAVQAQSGTSTQRVIHYGYDGLQRLTTAGENPGDSLAYTYDDTGNRTSVTSNGTQVESRSYDAANQVVGWTYDQYGRLRNDGTTSYTYFNEYDFLIRMTRGSESWGYGYNADGLLRMSSHSGVTTLYTQDLTASLPQIIQADPYNQSAATNYHYGLDRLDATTGGTTTWYDTDGLGSVRQTLDATGTPLGSIAYDPWGNVESGTVPTFGFTGELQNQTTGMVNLRARWYSTAQGRFGVHDPFDGFSEQPYSLNQYQYGYSDPVFHTDPSGKCIPHGIGGWDPDCRFIGFNPWNWNWDDGLDYYYSDAGTAGKLILSTLFPPAAIIFGGENAALSYIRYADNPTTCNGVLAIVDTTLVLLPFGKIKAFLPGGGANLSGGGTVAISYAQAKELSLAGVGQAGIMVRLPINAMASPENGDGSGDPTGRAPDLEWEVSLEEQDRDVVILSARSSNGDEVLLTGNLSREGDTIYLRGTHIEGPGANKMGLGAMRKIARAYGKQQGAKEVVIEGGVRTTGANIGKKPIPIKVKVE